MGTLLHLLEGKISLQGTLDPSCAYAEDQAGKNEENNGFAFPRILTSSCIIASKAMH